MTTILNVSIIRLPDLEKKDENRVLIQSGTFQISTRLENKSHWSEIKQAGDGRYITEEEDEDGIGYAGWNYNLYGIAKALKLGYLVKIDNLFIPSIQELIKFLKTNPLVRWQSNFSRGTLGEIAPDQITVAIPLPQKPENGNSNSLT
jgi:hypothetical protein